MTKTWIESRVVAKKAWTSTLYSLQLDAPLGDFRAGQFIQVALDIGDARVDRSYSLVNAPHARPLEIYFNEVPEGPLTPRLSTLEPGDRLWVSEKAKGLFTLDKVPDGRDLWLIATGTALGVYLSILDTETPWRRFQRVVLVYGCRTADELTYGDRTRKLLACHGDQFDFIPILSREHSPDALHGRVTGLLADGTLEGRANRAIDPENSQVMLCGNASMIRDMRALLEPRGLKRNSANKPGHFTTEQYF